MIGFSVESNKLTIEVTTNIDSIKQLIERFEVEGVIGAATCRTVNNHLDQAAHQLENKNKQPRK